MLQTVQLPAGIANLDTGLTDVDGDDFTHGDLVDEKWEEKETEGNSKISGEQERAFLQVVKFQKLLEAFEANANGGLLVLRHRNHDYATWGLPSHIDACALQLMAPTDGPYSKYLLITNGVKHVRMLSRA